MSPLPALRPATLGDLDAIYQLETAGFVPGIVEEKAVFARRISHFPGGFLVRPWPPAESPGAGSGLAAYFCGEIWTEWPGLSGRGVGAKTAWAERFQLNHDIANWHDPQGSVFYLASMTVAPALRGTGAGRALFQDGIACMTKAFPHLRHLVLIVNEAWAGARALYQAAGFDETGRLPDFFNARNDVPQAAIVMECSVTSCQQTKSGCPALPGNPSQVQSDWPDGCQ